MAKNGDIRENVSDVKQVQIVQVLVDMTDERILQFNADGKVQLVWKEDSFRELPEVIERQLSFENFKNYLVVKQHKKEAADAAVAQITGFEKPMLQLQDWANYRLRIRERRGWHSYWAAPGADFDMRIASGYYVQVRKPKELKDASGKIMRDANGAEMVEQVEPGQENGEVVKLLDGEGKVELIALECPIEFFEAVIKDASDKSVARFKNQNENFAQTIEEEINVKVPKDHRMKVFGEGDKEIKV